MAPSNRADLIPEFGQQSYAPENSTSLGGNGTESGLNGTESGFTGTESGFTGTGPAVMGPQDLNLTDAIAAVASAPATLREIQNEQGWQLLTQGDGPMHMPDLPADGGVSRGAPLKEVMQGGGQMHVPDVPVAVGVARKAPVKDVKA